MFLSNRSSQKMFLEFEEVEEWSMKIVFSFSFPLSIIFPAEKFDNKSRQLTEF